MGSGCGIEDLRIASGVYNLGLKGLEAENRLNYIIVHYIIVCCSELRYMMSLETDTCCSVEPLKAHPKIVVQESASQAKERTATATEIPPYP